MITAELLGTSRDTNQNIIIWIAFSKDGTPIEFFNGAALILYNGRKAWPLYAAFQNFDGKTAAQRLAWIRINVEHQIGNIIKGMIGIEAFVSRVEAQLASLVGQTIQKDSFTQQVDLNNDGVMDATITYKDDGTYTVA